MSQSIRTFIAIELPPDVKTLLDNVQQGLRSLPLKAKWVRTQNIHLTLKFLGNIDPANIEDIGRAMADAAGDCARFTLTVGGIGFFPGVKRPRVVWAGLGGETEILFKLQRQLAQQLAAIGYPKEKRPFKAHLTLGRIRQAVDPGTIGRAMQDCSNVGDLQFTADRITFFRSDLQPTGAVYTPLKRTTLK